MECNCNKSSKIYSYRYEDGEQEIFNLRFKLILDREKDRIYKCSICSTVWHAAYIPGGGLYGDVEWINISLSHWHNHWYWKIPKTGKQD